MIGLGKTYGNLMVDLQVSNEKLRDRALRIIQAATKCDNLSASKALDESDNHVKVAIVMLLLGITRLEAEEKLVLADSRIRKVISNSKDI
jgi:N-acetylmuramic acid 6-phosphate etherase